MTKNSRKYIIECGFGLALWQGTVGNPSGLAPIPSVLKLEPSVQIKIPSVLKPEPSVLIKIPSVLIKKALVQKLEPAVLGFVPMMAIVIWAGRLF